MAQRELGQRTQEQIRWALARKGYELMESRRDGAKVKIRVSDGVGWMFADTTKEMVAREITKLPQNPKKR